MGSIPMVEKQDAAPEFTEFLKELVSVKVVVFCFENN
jgi:hypothetical protein